MEGTFIWEYLWEPPAAINLTHFILATPSTGGNKNHQHYQSGRDCRHANELYWMCVI